MSQVPRNRTWQPYTPIPSLKTLFSLLLLLNIFDVHYIKEQIKARTSEKVRAGSWLPEPLCLGGSLEFPMLLSSVRKNILLAVAENRYQLLFISLIMRCIHMLSFLPAHDHQIRLQSNLLTWQKEDCVAKVFTTPAVLARHNISCLIWLEIVSTLSQI